MFGWACLGYKNARFVCFLLDPFSLDFQTSLLALAPLMSNKIVYLGIKRPIFELRAFS